MSCGSCSGVCCAAFPWRYSPEYMERWPAFVGGGTQEESRYIADMLVPLTPEQAKERHERFGVGHSQETYERQAAGERGNWYTCKHWDEDTMLCTQYEQRPQMCRDFPYENKCEHGCGYELPKPDRAVYDRRQIEGGWGPLEVILGEN